MNVIERACIQEDQTTGFGFDPALSAIGQWRP